MSRRILGSFFDPVPPGGMATAGVGAVGHIWPAPPVRPVASAITCRSTAVGALVGRWSMPPESHPLSGAFRNTDIAHRCHQERSDCWTPHRCNGIKVDEKAATWDLHRRGQVGDGIPICHWNHICLDIGSNTPARLWYLGSLKTISRQRFEYSFVVRPTDVGRIASRSQCRLHLLCTGPDCISLPVKYSFQASSWE